MSQEDPSRGSIQEDPLPGTASRRTGPTTIPERTQEDTFKMMGRRRPGRRPGRRHGRRSDDVPASWSVSQPASRPADQPARIAWPLEVLGEVWKTLGEFWDGVDSQSFHRAAQNFMGMKFFRTWAIQALIQKPNIYIYIYVFVCLLHA